MLPDYAMNKARFPEVYEQFLVGPLFRSLHHRSVSLIFLDG
jgi:hypothetical protein